MPDAALIVLVVALVLASVAAYDRFLAREGNAVRRKGLLRTAAILAAVAIVVSVIG